MRKLLILTIIISLFSCNKDENSSEEGGGNKQVDVAITGDVETEATYAIIDGYANLSLINIGSNILEYGAEISKTEDFINFQKNTTNEIEGNKLRVYIKDLKAKEKYFYRVYLKTGGVYYYGNTRSFYTKDIIEVTSTGKISDVTFTSAIANCAVNQSLLNNKESYYLGIAYSLSKEFINLDGSFLESHIATGNINVDTISINITKLQPGTTYYYCSFTSDGQNFAFGDVNSFTTLSNDNRKYLNTLNAIDISGRGASLQGMSRLNKLYKANNINYFFEYSDQLDNLINKTEYKQIEAICENETISAKISYLSENTVYFYRAVAEIDQNVFVEGDILSFTTNSIEAPKGYSLVWHDEFDKGSVLDASDWTHEVQKDHWVNNELQNYVNHTTPKGNYVTEVLDGTLRINCIKEDGKVYSGRVYAKVKEGWKYGYIEASIKLPKGKGTWPAFWMMPVNFSSWPADGEIDIMEEVGYHPDYVSSSLHANAHVHSNGTQVTHEMYCKGAEGEFHTYAIEWTAQNITTYVDDKKQLSYDNRGLGRDDWPYDDPFYVIFNLAWGGDWGGAQGIDESVLPITMEIDYIRVFQKK